MNRALLLPWALGLALRAGLLAALAWAAIALDVVAVADATRAWMVAGAALVVLAIDALLQVRAAHEHRRRSRGLAEAEREFLAGHRLRERAP